MPFSQDVGGAVSLEVSRFNIRTWNAILDTLSSERFSPAYNPYLNTSTKSTPTLGIDVRQLTIFLTNDIMPRPSNVG